MTEKTFYEINKGFYDQIIRFNQDYNDGPESFKIEKIKGLNPVKVPFFPIEINPYLYNRLMATCIRIVNGPNGNSTEIVVDHEKQQIAEIILIKADEAGNYVKYEDITSMVGIKYTEIKNVDALFDKVKSYLLDKEYIDIGTIKIIDSTIIDAYAELMHSRSNKIDYEQKITQGINFFLDILKTGRLIVFPKIRIYEFFKETLSAYPDFQEIINGSNKIRNVVPRGKISLTVHGKDWYLTLILNVSDDGNINISTRPAFEVGRIDQESAYKWINLIKKIGKKCEDEEGVEASYLLDIYWLIDVLDSVLNSEIPFSDERLQFLSQKLLYGVRSVERIWGVYPKPFIYNEIVRLVLRWFGYHINPRKISYWSLPAILSFLANKMFGDRSRIIILTSSMDQETGKMQENARKQYIESLLGKASGILLDKTSESLERLIHINQAEIQEYLENAQISTEIIKKEKDILYPGLKDKKMKDDDFFELEFKAYLYELRKKFQKKYGFIDCIFYLNQNYVHEIIRVNGVETMSWNPLKYAEIIKLVKKIKDSPDSFCIYPDIPFYQYFKQKGFGLTKELVPNLFDFREF